MSRSQTAPLSRMIGTVACAAIAIGSLPARASQIGPGAFGSGLLVESFEGLAVGPDVRLGLGASLLEPGTVAPYTFASGVTLTGPIPNPGYSNQGAFVHDFALGADVTNNWGGTRVVNDATDIPFGSAYLGAYNAGGTASIELTFSSDMARVGAYVTGATGALLQIDVYDSSNVLLESGTLGTVDLAQWSSNFLGIENAGGIRRVVFSGPDFGLDGLTFEAGTVPAPEPAPAFLLACGLMILAMQGRPRVVRLRR
ncbi:MAG TPA: hypothetical protein VMS55_11455 [Myxococcota bacterium]|nr:hypothetical protein [Myxococcota bacterium]